MTAAIERSGRGICIAPKCGRALPNARPNQITCGPGCRQRLSRARRRASTWSEQRAAEWGLLPRDFWRTPPEVFEAASMEWGPFELDAAAAGSEDSLCPLFLTPADDALSVRWAAFCRARGVAPRVWCNPPYSTVGGHGGGGMLSWVQQGLIEADNGATVCLLLPNNQATEWGRLAATRGRVRVLPRRVSFFDPDTGKQVHGNRHESMFVVFGAANNPRPVLLRQVDDPITPAGTALDPGGYA